MNKNYQDPATQQNFLKDLNERLQAEIRSELTATPFPFDQAEQFEVSTFKGSVLNILANTSLTKMKCDLDVYKQLHKEDFNLFSMSYILNVTQELTPSELNVEPSEYIQIINAAYKLGEIHGKFANPIKQLIQEKFQKEADEFGKKVMTENAIDQQKENKKVIPINRKKGK